MSVRWARITIVFGVLGILAGSACRDEPELRDETTDVGVEDGFVGPFDTEAHQFSRAFEQLAAIQCEKLFECCSASQRREFGVEADSADSCGDSFGFGQIFGLQAEFDALEAGQIRFDPLLAELCAESLRERSCAELEEGMNLLEARGLRGCREMLVPLVERGGSCTADPACKSGYCASGGKSGQDTCREPPSVGESCPDGTCESGAWCDESRLEPRCRPTKEIGDFCKRDRECASGLCEAATSECLEVGPLCETE